MMFIFQLFQSRRRASPFQRALLLTLYLVVGAAAATQGFFPLKEVHPGLRGIGRTVFQGSRVEQFQVEILGVLENVSPKQTIILARLGGGPLAETGVLQGMSGSPVYIDGKLLGAVALGFPFSKEPIAGIRPIEAMISGARFTPPALAHPSSPWRFTRALAHLPLSLLHPAASILPVPSSDLTEILTPLAVSGFTPATFHTFASRFDRLGFSLQQGVSGANPTSQRESGALVPGSMISVDLLSGDMNISAEGTVTYIDGKRIYAFGHQFLNEGSTDLPFARARVVALLPNLSSSFKIAVPGKWAGTIVSDRSTAIAGELGLHGHTVPVTISVHSPATGSHEYHMQSVDDRFLTPFILQAALLATLDATERTTGAQTLRLREHVDFQGNLPPLVVRDIFASDTGLAQQAAANAVVALNFVLGAGFGNLRLKDVSFTIEPVEAKRELRIAQIWASRHDVRPGEPVDITVLLEGDNGVEFTRTATYRVPVGAPLGSIYITASDANLLNFAEFAGVSQASARSPGQLIQFVNRFRGSGAAYVRVWRQEPAFSVAGTLPGRELTDPPPSIALILADPSASAASSTPLAFGRGSGLAEFTLPVDDYAVSGSQTIQVNISE
ncbi:MAG: SpoIVB peptidase S55 domain-containing protein [Bryobacteraceae bacterium]